MSHETRQQFGLFIAYFVPGFLAVAGTASKYSLFETWLGMATSTAPTVGGFLFITVSSVAAGLVLSTFRWLILDTIHAFTGLVTPQWDFRVLQAHVEAFELAIDHHYRYYQFYGNSVMAIMAIAIIRWPLSDIAPGQTGVLILLIVGWLGLFFVASRDCLQKYHTRAAALLQGPVLTKENHHAPPPTPTANERLSKKPQDR